MRDWTFTDIGGGFSELGFTIESDKEESQWRRTFPDGAPGEGGAKQSFDVVLTWEWKNVPTPGGQSVRRLVLRPQLRAIAEAKTSSGAPDVGRIADVSTRIAELVKKDDAELDTLAGELQVKFKKKDTKAQKAAAIVQRQDELAALTASTSSEE